MKKIIKSYRIFVPDLYTILGTFVGSILLCAMTIFLCRVTLPEFTLIMTFTMLFMLDMLGDFFVFQGVFSKNFDFGLLPTSLKGFGVLKMAVIGDQIRRIIQISVVTIVCGIMIKPTLFERGFFGDSISYAGFLIVLILAIYCGNNLTLNVTRCFSNYAEGIFPMSFCTLLEGVALFAVESLFLGGEKCNPLPFVIVMTIIAVALTFIMNERIRLKFMDSFGERENGRFGDDSRKKMIVFLLTAFGCSFLMIPAMKVGFDAGADLSAVMVAQMMYPACGVVLAKLFSYNEGKLPKAAYVTILLTGMLTLIISAISLTTPMTVEFNGAQISVFYSIASTVVIIASIAFLIMVIASGAEKRNNSGFRFPNAGRSFLFVLLFVGLYFAYVLGNMLLQAIFTGVRPSEALTAFFSIFALDKDHALWFSFVLKLINVWLPLLINLPLSILIFVGEEYGWRYYLQPRMQKRFGIALGTVLLGVAWGIWHAGADVMFYSTETGLQMIIVQIVACISLGIFMAYAYMKTENIWVPVMMHFFNNNLFSVFAGGNPVEAMTGKVIDWALIPTYIISYSVFWLFIFTPLMMGKIKEKTTSEKTSFDKTQEA